MTTTDQIKAILAESKERADAATPAPWIHESTAFGFHIVDCVVRVDGGYLNAIDLEEDGDTAAFIAAARTDLPARDAALLIAVDALDDFASGLSGPYKVDRAKHAESVIGATETRCGELLSSILAILKGEK